MSLTKQSVSAVKWSVLGTTFRFGLQLGAQIVLARLLGPENYGLFALGLIVLTFSNMLGNFGLAWGLVQTQNLSDEDVRFVFTWQLTSGFIVAIGVFILAPALAIFFKEPRIELIIKWLSLACFLVALTAPASHLLRRKLDFKWISIIDVTSYTISYIFIGIPLAYYGAGVWTLVVAWLSQSFCALIFTFMRSPHPIKLLFWHSKARSITGVGVTVLLTNVCNWLLNNFDRILLGRFLNAQAVGLYTVPYNFANTPNSLLISALQPAFLAAGARIQEDLNRLRKVYLSVLATIWIVIVPMFVIMSMCAPDLMFVLYGSAWASSGVILAILALAMPAYITWAMSTPILWNTNRKHWESLLQFPIIIIAGIAFYNFASQGGVIVAVVTSCVLLLRAIVITSAACHQLRISFRDISGYLLRGLVMSSITVAGCYFGAELGHLLGSGHWYGLLGSSLVATVMLIVVSLYIPIILGGEVIEMLGRFSPSLSSLLKRRINTFAKVVSEL